MNELNTDRIIGDCLEINGDIINRNFNSRFPKFICNIRERYYRNKLIKIVNKIKKSNTPLKACNIYELACYVYNNYIPNGTFGCIYKIKYFDKYNRYNVYVKYDDIKAIIMIEDQDHFDLSIEYYKNNILTASRITLKTMETNNTDIKKKVFSINKALTETIADYILNILNGYNRKEK